MDDLFQERLDAFLNQTLSDISTFAAREQRPADEVRRRVAEWHVRYLFSRPTSASSGSALGRAETIRTTLVDVSRTLESLHESTGIHSLLLSVDPLEPADDGFVGGTVLAREFWRGLRGGGEKGIAALRAQARAIDQQPEVTDCDDTKSRKTPAYKLKTEVYSRVRTALRAVSGVRNADMKWTNHANLNAYGVRVEGWPVGVPLQNPSTLSVVHNTAVKAALDAGSLRFCRLEPSAPIAAIHMQLPWNDFLDESLNPVSCSRFVERRPAFEA
ncbi:hypothetical protein K488DRAFT_48462 [Vararia minispora EC-137]|uniref:Uncharacterized protein n=1 Tax=Vararia minispora EC-137 TaxID=1314806 RepID=A0ACB8QNL0_9AGAM|nr:hypothetical protein K488DRAFT_48462 [Vararia minispora EC-137]